MFLIKWIYKSIKWFFGVRSQYKMQRKLYQKSNNVFKIILLILMFALAGGAIALELWTFKLFKTNFILAIVMSIFTVGSIVISTKASGLYSMIAFISAAKTKSDDVVENMVAPHESTYQVENGEFVLRQSLSEEIIRPQTVKKSHSKGVNLLVGFGCLIACIGLFVASILLLVFKLKQALPI